MLERVDKLIVSQGQYSRSEVKALVPPPRAGGWSGHPLLQ